MIDFKFLYLQWVFDDFLIKIHILSKYLQDVIVDMTNSIILMESTKKNTFWS